MKNIDSELLVMQVACLVQIMTDRHRQTDMEGPTMCSLLTLEHKEHLIRVENLAYLGVG
jgi:hypothetical protein